MLMPLWASLLSLSGRSRRKCFSYRTDVHKSLHNLFFPIYELLAKLPIGLPEKYVKFLDTMVLTADNRVNSCAANENYGRVGVMMR